MARSVLAVWQRASLTSLQASVTTWTVDVRSERSFVAADVEHRRVAEDHELAHARPARDPSF